jgi:hypothetical protein
MYLCPIYAVGLRSFARWNFGFESRRGPGCLSVVSVGGCQVEISLSGLLLVQRSPTECDHEASSLRKPSLIRWLLPSRGRGDMNLQGETKTTKTGLRADLRTRDLRNTKHTMSLNENVGPFGGQFALYNVQVLLFSGDTSTLCFL